MTQRRSWDDEFMKRLKSSAHGSGQSGLMLPLGQSPYQGGNGQQTRQDRRARRLAHHVGRGAACKAGALLRRLTIRKRRRGPRGARNPRLAECLFNDSMRRA